MQPKLIYAALAVLGLGLGFFLTGPPQLRALRWFQMLLVPILFCSAFFAGSGVTAGTLNTVLGVVLLLAAGAALCLTLMSNVHYFAHERFYQSIAPLRKPPLLEDIHIQPIRQLVAGEKFEQACARLEALLKDHRTDFPELFLMSQLYHQLNRNADAVKCLLDMIPLARDEAEQFTAMKFYHQLGTTQ